MGTFFESLLQLILLICLPPCLLGLLAWGARQICCMLVGDEEGRPLLQAFSVLSTPLRELGHVIACVLFLHRIEEMRLLDLHDPDGEWGFVEHSYHPRNPIAVLGNLPYALGPIATGLLAVLVICSTCFYGVIPQLFGEITALVEAGAGLGAYVKAAISLIPGLFTTGSAPMVLRILGCVLLLAVCFGIYVSPIELKDALGGLAIFSVLATIVAGVLMLFDDRVLRIFFGGIRAYAAGVTALFLVVLLALAALIVIGLLFRIARMFFNRGDAGGEV